MELWDVYDRDRIKTGKLVPRAKNSLSEGEYHLTVHVAIFSPDGRMLIQRRVDNKESWPSMWDMTVGGAVTQGEDSRLGAERELFEELGISVSFEDMRPHLTVHSTDAICDVYILTREVDIASLRLQSSEVQDARYATLDEIITMIRNGDFIPYHESFISLLFDFRNSRGGHRQYKGDEKRQSALSSITKAD